MERRREWLICGVDVEVSVWGCWAASAEVGVSAVVDDAGVDGVVR